MEANVFKVVLRHLEDVTGVSEENISAFTVFCHILIFTLLEVFQFCGIVAFYPACLVERNRFPTTLGVVFIFKSVLDDFKLKLTDGANDFTPIELVDE